MSVELAGYQVCAPTTAKDLQYPSTQLTVAKNPVAMTG
jgi:hypothetical protein